LYVSQSEALPRRPSATARCAPALLERDTCDQPQNRKRARPHSAIDAASQRRRGDRVSVGDAASAQRPFWHIRTLRNVRYLVGYWGQSGTTEIYENTPLRACTHKRVDVGFRGKAEILCSIRTLPVLTPSCHRPDRNTAAQQAPAGPGWRAILLGRARTAPNPIQNISGLAQGLFGPLDGRLSVRQT
jgi:hypothetical protein